MIATVPGAESCFVAVLHVEQVVFISVVGAHPAYVAYPLRRRRFRPKAAEQTRRQILEAIQRDKHENYPNA